MGRKYVQYIHISNDLYLEYRRNSYNPIIKKRPKYLNKFNKWRFFKTAQNHQFSEIQIKTMRYQHTPIRMAKI